MCKISSSGAKNIIYVKKSWEGFFCEYHFELTVAEGGHGRGLDWKSWWRELSMIIIKNQGYLQ